MNPITTKNYPPLQTGQLSFDKNHEVQGLGKDIPDWCLEGAHETLKGLDEIPGS